MADLNVDDYLNDATKWTEPDPAYLGDVLVAVGGHPSATDRAACATNLVNLSVHSPVAVAYVHASDMDAIQVCHSLTRFPAVLGDASPMDNRVVALQGKSLDGSIPIIFPADAFERTTVRAYRLPIIVGATGHGAAPPVFQAGPHGGGVADTDEVIVRKVMTLPPPAAGTAVGLVPSGRYTHAAFHNVLLNTGLTNPDVHIQAVWRPVSDWFRAALTDTAGGGVSVAVAPVDVTAPHNTFRTNAWAIRVKSEIKSRAGVGGPGLTNNVFNAGVADLRTTLNDNATRRLEFERARNERSFTERHGSQLADRMHRLCGVAADADLPEVHQLLAKSTSKSRDYAIINNLFQERATSSTVPLTAANSPIATTTLVDDVFRSFTPATSGLTFGRGLTPFAIVCDGHQESHALIRLMKQAEVAESSSSLTLSDAERLTSTDVKFPTTPFFAGEKLYGWSVVIDVFHGRNTDVANSVRAFATNTVPHLRRIHDQMADTPAVGMDLVCRVLYEAQQIYYLYARELGAGNAPPPPSFQDIENKVVTYRVTSLSPLPATWYNKIDAPTNANRPSGSSSNSSVRGQAGASSAFNTSAFNTNADRRLLSRFRDSGHSTISALMQGHDVTIPKHGNQQVCLTWALKGECSTGCRRQAQHVRYGRSTVQALHSMLDACGVANSQE